MSLKVSLIIYVAFILAFLTYYGYYNDPSINSAVKHYGWDAIVLFDMLVIILFSVLLFNLPF